MNINTNRTILNLSTVKASPASAPKHLKPQATQPGETFQLSSPKDQQPIKFQSSVNQSNSYYDAKADATKAKNYYGSILEQADSLDGMSLYRELNKRISQGTRNLGYSGARNHLYATIDRHPDGKLYSFYSGEGPMFEGDSKGGNPLSKGEYNCEHIVPQSWFNKQGVMRADLHHLVTELITCNSFRGSHEYNDVDNPDDTFPSCGIRQGNNSGDFEPYANKGAAARAVLYFLTRHPKKVGDRDREIDYQDIKVLKRWSRENPPTEWEKRRNSEIEKVQGNRNPYIDFPEWVDKVDFSNSLDQGYSSNSFEEHGSIHNMRDWEFATTYYQTSQDNSTKPQETLLGARLKEALKEAKKTVA